VQAALRGHLHSSPVEDGVASITSAPSILVSEIEALAILFPEELPHPSTAPPAAWRRRNELGGCKPWFRRKLGQKRLDEVRHTLGSPEVCSGAEIARQHLHISEAVCGARHEQRLKLLSGEHGATLRVVLEDFDDQVCRMLLF